MSTQWNLVGVAVVACVAVAVPAAAQTSNAQVTKDFGAQLLAGAPASVQSGTPVEKAKYAFTRYCDGLAKNKVPVNSNLWTRLQNWAGNGNATRWTCGDHAENLDAPLPIGERMSERGVGRAHGTGLLTPGSRAAVV